MMRFELGLEEPDRRVLDAAPARSLRPISSADWFRSRPIC